MTTMTTFTIDTDEDNEDLGQAVTETDTHTLIDVYRHLESKTLFQYVADELDFRLEGGYPLPDSLAEEIRETLGK